jgi:uncharacterized membrane protein YwaF
MNESFNLLLPDVNELCLHWATTLLHFVWQGVIAFAVVAMGHHWLRDRSATSRYWFNTIVLFSLPVCIVITFVCVGNG